MGARSADTRPAHSGAAAFFDVDETLITVKSMFSFLRFHLARRGEPEETYERLTAPLHRDAAGDVPRREVNRRYYRLYAGESAAGLAEAGRAWFDEQLALGGLFIEEPLERLRRHRAEGDFVVLLSGSFSACLDPVAWHTGAHWAIGTRPVVRRGALTGEVVTPMIGAAKGRAAHAVAAVRGLDLAASTAYADHHSDLELLTAVGTPVVVGDDAALTEHAARAGWERLTPVPQRPGATLAG
ncbi:HAD-IB family hydrolase [Streptomyces sp. A3M-1-3]|uniref:HAD family hydrolase n=1 Tax=Streptomyces sp. A3M-1-3 TaxID=2962044 RepID=UPI0020B7E38F|nr:HAD-IB family hydrolase [Streptomyces sp. A3M-1-3]MCP3821644.1 HAD-IB family hydrolase [Streptomyces sp. A3M-1-3]